MAIPFHEAVAVYLDFRAREAERASTAGRLAVSFTSLLRHFGATPVEGITAADLERFKAWRLETVKRVTVRHDLHALSGWFQFAERQGWREGNPVRQVRVPSDRDSVRIHVVSAEEERRYLEEARHHRHLHALARLMLATGMRPSEGLHLRRGDADLAARSLRIREGKTAAARRTLRLAGDGLDAVAGLAEGRASEEYLFPGRHGGARTKLNNAHDRACRRAGVRFVLYDLRHTFATRMAGGGVPLPTLAAILGHASLRCVLRYIHPSQVEMDRALEMFASGR